MDLLLGNYLKELRGELSLRKLGKELNFSIMHMSECERGIKYPSKTILKRYSDFFNVELIDLILLKGMSRINKDYEQEIMQFSDLEGIKKLKEYDRRR